MKACVPTAVVTAAGLPLSVLLMCCLAPRPAAVSAAEATGIVDILSFGVPASEQSHNLAAPNSDVVAGGLGEPARRLLPVNPVSWEGGKMAFTMKIDPLRPNYFTIRLWGDDVTQNRLLLYCEGKQIGYRHLGDVDNLDFGTEDRGYNGRFYYNTSPLPLSLTTGKTELHCEIRSNGRIWGYGTTFDKYQYPMTEPTRGIYRVYTHTDGYFVPATDENQGAAPANPPLRTAPGPEVLDQLKARVNRDVNNLLNGARPLNQPQLQFLARAYYVKWTPAYQNPQVAGRALQSLDATFVAYRKNPKLAESDPATYNPDWFGLGPSGYAIALLAGALRPHLDDAIDDGAGGRLKRRAAYSEMLIASRDWHRRNRRQYTNQSMINDLYGIYLSNRGVEVVDPGKAMPEAEIRHYLYESVGLQPWLGSDTDNGPAKPLGDNYRQLTDKGLTKELGYVGTYGEVLDWVTTIYDATRPAPDQPGDARIKAQLIKMAHARAIFRRPALDSDGFRAMRMETIIGWRDEHYPGDVTYGQRAAWDASTLYTAAATLDPDEVGYAQQMLADNQFFSSLRDQMKETGFRTTAGLLETPDQYDLIKAQPPTGRRLPMSPGQPDFVWFDEEDGVVALKHGEDIFYTSLYWRARFGINDRARVHYSVPAYDRIAVVQETEQFTPSWLTYRQPNETNGQGLPWLPQYPGDMHSAHEGEELPIAEIPADVPFKPGQENAYAGRADFYALRYGPYLIGMNSTKDKTFALPVPAAAGPALELVSGKAIALNTALKIGPQSTVVLYLPAGVTPAVAINPLPLQRPVLNYGESIMNGLVEFQVHGTPLDPDADVVAFSDLIRRYPTAFQFKATWGYNIGGGYGDGQIIYDRRSRTIRTHASAGGEGAAGEDITDYLYRGVTDEVLHELAATANADWDGLVALGCKRTGKSRRRPYKR